MSTFVSSGTDFDCNSYRFLVPFSPHHTTCQKGEITLKMSFNSLLNRNEQYLTLMQIIHKEKAKINYLNQLKQNDS